MTVARADDLPHHAGLVLGSTLVASGISEVTIARRVASGMWWRPLPGVVALFPRMELSRQQRRTAALLWLPPCAVISHYDAAAMWGFGVTLTDELHAHVDRNHNPRPQPGYVVHRIETLADQDRTERAGLRVTSLERTVVDTFDVMPVMKHRRGLIAEVFRRHRSTEARLLGVAARVPKLHRREELISTIALAVGGSHSAREMDHFEWLGAAGFGGFERQFPTVVAGRVRWLDACDPLLRVCYEIDGPVHDEDGVREADEALDLALTGDGWVVVRLRSNRTRRTPQIVADELRAVRKQRQRLVDAGVLTPAVRAPGL
ncbi:MAG TPA: hypothetical protein VNA14_07170 [Mycobacteriales bacterium]|nr:hypothetical protein [Mycobacteriales bacterium]